VKITDVQSCVIGRSEPTSGGSVWTFVRVYTDEGIFGTGECNSAGAEGSGFANKEIVRTLKPLLVGQDPMNVGPLYEIMRRSHKYGGTASAPIIFAVTGIENALYDIIGKALGVPTCQLLGGTYRHNLRLYADFHAGAVNEPQAYAEKALEVIDEGFSAVKFDVDRIGTGKLDPYNWTVGTKEMTHIIKLVQTVREAIGHDIDLAIDCHGQFDLPSAITLAKELEGLRLLWLEDPVPFENVDALAQLRASTSTVVCTGENHYTRFEFLDLLRAHAVDVIMPDLAKAGGIMEGKRIAELADVHYIPFAPHNVSSPLGMMAACHVCASVPNFLMLEYHARDVAWWSDLCNGDKPFIHGGWMTVSDQPGNGVELNDDVAKSLLWNGDTYFVNP
jgi:L-alanine-DL-glutamate epimerase-like enolase superfamily enzyme